VTTIKAYQMTYTIVRDTAVRFGTLTVTTDATTSPSYVDNYTENSATGVALTITQSGNQVSVKYTSTNTGLTGTLTYSLAHLA
jgi:hypothetical protein